MFRLMRRQANRFADSALIDEDLSALEVLLDRHKVADWGGFSDNAKNVLDGDSFSLLLDTDARKVSAGGYMRFPKDYREVRDELSAFLDAVIAKSGAETQGD